MRLSAALLACAIAASAAAGEFPIVQGKPQVIDGDSLRIRCAHGEAQHGAGENCQNVELRLYGIDAPEWRQNCFYDLYNGQIAYRCGVIARAQLLKIIDVYALTCQPVDHDRYGRTVAWCALPDGETDIAELLVRRGWAIVTRDFEHLAPDRIARYAAAEALAREERIGLWQGEFTIPARWRAEHRSER